MPIDLDISALPPVERLPFATAVKALIVREGKVLVLKRNMNRPHHPGRFDIPGGRLDNGENPIDGLRREIREEAGIEIDVGPVLGIHHFKRDDGQLITMIIFLCFQKGDGDVAIEKEAMDAFAWLPIDDPETDEKLEKFGQALDVYRKVFAGRDLGGIRFWDSRQ